MMSEQVAMTDPVDLSIGGMKGHIFRRIFHLSMFFIPIVYFEYGMDFADYVDLTLHEVVSVIVIIAAIGEGIRLKLGFTVFGQRDYESGQVSALAWGALGIGLVLLLVPTKEYAYPLIFSLTFGDPFMGEIRRRGVEGNNVIIYSSLFLSLALFIFSYRSISGKLRARNKVEKIISNLLLASATVAIFATAGILLSVLFEAIRFFQIISFDDFLFGLTWSPQMAIREDQVGSSGLFGAIPLFAGTALISLISLTVAVPVGLMTAIYLSEYAPSKVRSYTKPMLEILSGIPTVVYGFFAAITLAPFIRDFGVTIGLDIASESALGVGLVMGIMIIPLVSSLSDDVISAVPQAMRDGSYGLGATKSETIKKVISPAALPGIVGGILLAASRAIGETMIVVMAAGLSARLSFNPIDAVTTVTVQIVTLLVGDQEFDSPKTLAAFALGLTLFVVTLALNFYALKIVRKYREQYE